MKLSQEFIREMIKDALLEEDEEDIIRGLDSPEIPDAGEVGQQTVAAMEQMVAELEGIHKQLQAMGEMIRGVKPELNVKVTEAISVIKDLMNKIDESAKERENEDTE